jgi:hypothetical protein
MELLFRSVARAGGIEVPAEVRFFAPPKRTPWERRLFAKLARALPALLSALWRRLARTAGRLAANAAPSRTPAHP